jgi:predicted HTH transcriptional regulator
MKKTAVYKRVTRFSDGRDDEELMKRNQDSQQQAELKKTLQKFAIIVHENRRLTVRSTAEQANIDRETVRKILTEDLDMRKVCAKMGPNDLLTWHCL